MNTTEPTSPAPDRHEASRQAFEARWPKYSTKRKNGKYVHLPVHSSWEEWQAALDWQAAQEQPAPEPTQGSAREWLHRDKRTWPHPDHAQHINFEGCDSIVIAPEDYQSLLDDALELADRADAAEKRCHNFEHGYHIHSARADDMTRRLAQAQEQPAPEPTQGTCEECGLPLGPIHAPPLEDGSPAMGCIHCDVVAKLAAAQAEAGKLREALEIIASDDADARRRAEDALTPNTDTK